MARAEAEAFAAGWIDAWNRRDIEWVLARFAEDAVFMSPTADQVTGSPVVRGKQPLREYWTAALSHRTTPLGFELDHAIWDDARQESPSSSRAAARPAASAPLSYCASAQSASSPKVRRSTARGYRRPSFVFHRRSSAVTHTHLSPRKLP